MSSAWPRSSASSCASSIGKPYVATSANASSARDRLLAGEVFEHLHAARERLGELLLLGAHDPLDLLGVLAQHRVRVAHLLDDDGGQTVDTIEADALGLVDRPPQQATADVAAALVRRLDPFGDQERDGAAVVGEHAMRALRDLGSRCRRLPTRARSNP